MDSGPGGQGEGQRKGGGAKDWQAEGRGGQLARRGLSRP